MPRRAEYKPIGLNVQFNPYHERFDFLKLQSHILNESSHPVDAYTILWDDNRLQWEIEKLKGAANPKYPGEYYHSTVDEWRVAIIPGLEKKLKAIETEFKRLQKSRKDSALSPLKEMPGEMFKKKLLLEADMDVSLEELDFLEKELKRRESIVKKVYDDNILKHGLCGGSKTDRNGVLCEIHGQKVVRLQDDEETLIIGNGPYRGMAVLDYRKLSEAWCNDRKRKSKEAFLKRQKEIAEKGFSNIKMPHPLGLINIDKRSLPPWPEGVKNYFATKEDLKRVQRTR
jgi:hypothetical protein